MPDATVPPAEAGGTVITTCALPLRDQGKFLVIEYCELTGL